MPRTIVILLDGTSNAITERRTNILRLYGCLRKTADQVVYYDPGVGTIGRQDVWSRRAQAASEVWGMATGMGIDDNVKEAYRFLIDAGATPQDRICIFGFSRGAYTARMLAGFIHVLGLLERRNLNLLDYAWRAYKRIGDTGQRPAEDAGVAARLAEVRLYRRILAPAPANVHLLGLFDTVASVIEPGPRLLPRFSHHAFTSCNPGVAHVRHAVALDERRRLFDALRWPEGQGHRPDPAAPDLMVPQDAREVWFTGSHADIGGGLPEPASALAKLPLEWMIGETGPLGLDYDPATVDLLVRGRRGGGYVAPDAGADIHDTLTLPWKVLEHVPFPPKDGGRWIPAGRPRPVPAGARVHASVIARARARGRMQVNIPQDRRIDGDPDRWAR